MNILALDTATPVLSAALSTGEGVWHFEINAGLTHSELLMEAVDRLIKTAGLKPSRLDLVACMKGPGSFTGLRIGFAAAKGIALSLGIPLRTVPTLDCMADPFENWQGIVIPVIDARKHSFFTALYRGKTRISGYMDAGIPAIAGALKTAVSGEAAENENRILLTGPDADMIKGQLEEFFPKNCLFFDPHGKKGRGPELLEVVKKYSILDNISDEIFSGPLYLRKSDAEINFNFHY
jgi:tRNA threonylcarbamoyladenosine biosynthesis protein TsaB